MTNCLCFDYLVWFFIAINKLKPFAHIVSLIYDSTKMQSSSDLFVSYFVYSVFIVVDSRSSLWCDVRRLIMMLSQCVQVNTTGDKQPKHLLPNQEPKIGKQNQCFLCKWCWFRDFHDKQEVTTIKCPALQKHSFGLICLPPIACTVVSTVVDLP